MQLTTLRTEPVPLSGQLEYYQMLVWSCHRLSTNYFGALVAAVEFQNWKHFPLVWEKVFSKRYATFDCIVPGPQTYAVLTHCGRIKRIDFYMLFISQRIY